jgi:ankyrin repeat protein
MTSEAVRTSIDAGDVDALRDALRNHPTLVTALMSAPDIQATSPLTYVGMARFYGYASHDRTGELARVLLEAGADKDDETKNGSPLICAASHGDAHVVRALLDAGADVELTDNPAETALRLAAAFGYPEVVDLLVAAGARPQSIIEAAAIGDLSANDLNALSEFDRACVLRAASVNERLDVIDQLLAAGTPIDAEVDGQPAIYWAQQRGRSSAVAHLKKRAAVA